jgi:hypothetical protein
MKMFPCQLQNPLGTFSIQSDGTAIPFRSESVKVHTVSMDRREPPAERKLPTAISHLPLTQNIVHPADAKAVLRICEP